MKKIKYYILLSFWMLSFSMKSQNQETEKKNIEPLIISTDLLAPLSVGVEKVFAKRHALKFRYHNLILATKITDPVNGFLHSFIGEYKFYLKPVKTKEFTYYIGAYYKFRQSQGFLPYENNLVNNSLIGINCGNSYFFKHVVFDFSCGAGGSLSYLKDKSTIPIDFRLNFSIGIPIY
jgi:hypothetical protein